MSNFTSLICKCSYVAAATSLIIVLAFSISPTTASAQTGSNNNSDANKDKTAPSGPVLRDGWGTPVTNALKPGEKPAPAPRHDISGTWEPARGPGDGIQAFGPRDMPSDGAPGHEPPFTAFGLETYRSHKPLEGEERVLESLSNDPRNKCDPLGSLDRKSTRLNSSHTVISYAVF